MAHQNGSGSRRNSSRPLDLGDFIIRDMLKTVTIDITHVRHVSGRKATLCEQLLGFSPGCFQTLLNSMSEEMGERFGAVFTADDVQEIDSCSILVCSLSPGSELLLSGRCCVGDHLVSINGRSVRADTINSFLRSRLNEDGCFSLFLEFAPINYDKLQAIVSRKSRTTKQTYCIDLLKGNRFRTIYDALSLFPFILCYYKRDATDEEMRRRVDIVYMHPSSNEYLIDIRDVFTNFKTISLSEFGGDVTVTAVTVQSQKVYVIELPEQQQSEHSLLLGLPASLISLEQMNNIMELMARLVHYEYGDYDNAFRNCIESCSITLSLFVYKLVCTTSLLSDLDIPTNLAQAHLEGQFLECQLLLLPDNIKSSVDDCLSAIESGEFTSDDLILDTRRIFNVLGASVFHRGLLLASHLNVDDLYDCYLYCNSHGYLLMSASDSCPETLIWSAVHPTKKTQLSNDERAKDVFGYSEPPYHNFLLGLTKGPITLVCLLELCDMTIDPKDVIPDKHYIYQLRQSISNLESMGLPAFCDEKLASPPNPIVHSMDDVVDRLNASSISGNAMKIKNVKKMFNPKRSFKFASVFGKSAKDKNGSDIDDAATAAMIANQQVAGAARSRRDGGGSSYFTSSTETNPDTGQAFEQNTSLPNLFDMSDLKNNESDLETIDLRISFNNPMILHYLLIDDSQGVFVSPFDRQLSRSARSLHKKVITNFCKTMLIMRDRLLSRPNCDGVKEEGVAFECPPDMWSAADVSTQRLLYWVVGRQLKHRLFFVCFLDSDDDDVCDAAFQLAFGLIY